ncbi:MAG: Glu-tRNA(Gln) amidotransferase subunit GatE [Polyangia bacterium]|jgi:glutamyl-tRNA(Gln) amidotransferase subunit E|nr:Glu-tRNA(Gln) amidotransferase subunit GatE [Polyangia bacterium]
MTEKKSNDNTSYFRGPLGRLADAGIDWAAIGFKCGLEIHQQLDTPRKLFCRCPAGRYSDDFDAEVLRHMRPTLSEMGEYDGTALMEFKTKKQIVYRLNRQSVCTYEMDDTPPFEINQQAVDIALEVALLCGCSLVGELHVIRKQYLDGSIPAGFQRTAIVGVDGAIPFMGRTLHIRQVSVEEDACREVTDRGHQIVFLTDRLSMPLVEVVTEPEIFTPSEAGEAAQVIGDLMRVTGKVRRGMGATRQDVNVSVTGGTRVEIKGVPRIKMIPPLVRNEGLRQRALLNIREQLNETLRRSPDYMERSVSDLMTDCTSPVISSALRRGEALWAIRIPGGQSVIHAPTQPGRTFTDELAGRIRVVACLDTVPNCFTGPDEHHITGRRWHHIRRRVRARKEDAVVVCFGPDEDVRTALTEVRIRFDEARQGIPNETRQALGLGITDFERILPGPDRMYPDTDSPPCSISDARIERLQAGLPTPPWERLATLRAGGVQEDAIGDLAIHPRYSLAARLLAKGHPGVLVGYILGQLPRWLKRCGLPSEAMADQVLEDLCEAVLKGRVNREALPALLRALVRRPPGSQAPSMDALFAELGLQPLDRPIKDVVAAALQASPPCLSADPEARIRYFMGVVMEGLRGRAQGRSVRDEVVRQIPPVAKATPKREGAEP